MDWPIGFDAVGGGVVDDVQAVTVYTFESCMNACDSFNVQREGECKGITYNADLSSSVGFSGGNCIMKSRPAKDGVETGDTIASAAVLNGNGTTR